MIDRLLDASIRFRWAVIAITLLVAVYGAFQLFRLPIDAVPDITNKQVQVNVSAPQFGPLDMERLVTFPVETALAGIPGLDHSRSMEVVSRPSRTTKAALSARSCAGAATGASSRDAMTSVWIART